MRFILLLAALVGLALPASAQTSDFQTWLRGLRQDAMSEGISATTLDRAFAGVSPIARIIELDHQQPETTLTFAQYMERVVPPARRDAARQHYLDNKPLLDEIGRRYGVPPRYIVALWGIETDFGRKIGTCPVIAALATLAYDGRRSSFFRRELINALKIVETDHIDPQQMIGSWAGAMGQSQFMPSSFLAYAVSYRGGKAAPDIWNRTDDVFASIANYLASNGWRGDQRWGDQVRVPAALDSSQIGPAQKKPVAEWSALGVRNAKGDTLRGTADSIKNAALIEPGGGEGPAFLVYDNFRVILRWNNSTYFAVAVGALADSVD